MTGKVMTGKAGFNWRALIGFELCWFALVLWQQWALLPVLLYWLYGLWRLANAERVAVLLIVLAGVAVDALVELRILALHVHRHAVPHQHVVAAPPPVHVAIAEAPAPFRRSSVSQKTDSWQTACTATWPGRPISGTTVGASAPGRIELIAVSAASGALRTIYLLSCVAMTPSIRVSSIAATPQWYRRQSTLLARMRWRLAYWMSLADYRISKAGTV